MRISGNLRVYVGIVDHGEEKSYKDFWFDHQDDANLLALDDGINDQVEDQFESMLTNYKPEQGGGFSFDAEHESIELDEMPLHALKRVINSKISKHKIQGYNVRIQFQDTEEIESDGKTPEPDGGHEFDDGKNDYYNFMSAAMSGNLKVIDRIIASGKVDINNYMDIDWYEQQRAIQYATYYGHIEVVRRLIAAGANVDIGIPTSLCIAAKKGHLDIFNLLLEAGADINLTCKKNEYDPGTSILAEAAKQGNDAIVHRCIELGVDVNKDEPLYLACTNISEARYANYANTIRLLVEAGANVDTPKSPLVYKIIENGYIDLIRLLVPHIHNQEVLDKRLFDAVLRGREVGNVAPFTEIVNLLLQQGANPDAPNHERGYGRSVLTFVDKATQTQLLMGTIKKTESIAHATKRLGFTAAEIAEMLRQRAASRRGPALTAWAMRQAEIRAEEEGEGKNNNQGGGRRTRRRSHRRQRKLTRARSRK